MDLIPFSEMLKILRSGEPCTIEYFTYSESRKSGGDKRLITCRKAKSKYQKTSPVNYKPSPYKDDIIIMDLELLAGDVPTGEFRKVYPLFINKINQKQVQIGL